MKRGKMGGADATGLPARARAKAKRSNDGFKYFMELQVKLIRRTARDAAALAREKGQVTAVREWMLIDLLRSTGMREAEAADIRCGDIQAGYTARPPCLCARARAVRVGPFRFPTA